MDCAINNNPEQVKGKLVEIRDNYIGDNPGKRADWDTINDNFKLSHDRTGHFTDCISDCIDSKNRGSCLLSSIISMEEI